jgi:hypothetical protein
MKWTQKPWRAYTPPQDSAPRDIRAGDGLIAQVAYLSDDGEQAANAHLIAAAPELYEALEAAEDILAVLFRKSDGSAQELLGNVRSALAKARGEKA